MQEDTIEWMTGQRKYCATFGDFADANMLDYDLLTTADSHNIAPHEPLPESETFQFYEPPHTSIHAVPGTTTGLRHHPAVI